jgi:hypothetical protein
MRIVALSWLIWRGGIVADLMEQGVEAGYVDLPPATRRLFGLDAVLDWVMLLAPASWRSLGVG